jgi:hypothetical protein
MGEERKMFVRVRMSSVAEPGKLWTGDTPEDGAVAEVELVELHCECGASTRKFRISNELPVQLVGEAIDVSQLPIAYISCGGVGSTRDSVEALEAWNWSGRVGGSVIIDPLVVLEGYVSCPPPTKNGFKWICLYSGSTLNGFVLVRLDKSGNLHPDHCPLVRTVDQARECPPCREKRISAALNGVEEMFIIETDVEYLKVGEGEELPAHAVRAWAAAPTLEGAKKGKISFLYEGGAGGRRGPQATGHLQDLCCLRVKIKNGRVSHLLWVMKSGEMIEDTHYEFIGECQIAGINLKVGQWFPDYLIPKEAETPLVESDPVPLFLNEELISLANRAKDVSGESDYALANSIFAYLLEKFFQEGENSGLELELETQDLEGRGPSEVFYDLLVARAGESTLCIPVPLLESKSALTAAKAAAKVFRREHERDSRSDPTEMKILWQEVLEKVGREALEASFYHLVDKVEIPFLE